MTDLDKSFEVALKNFDFEKVHKCMTLLNWTWCGEGVPSIEIMNNVCRRNWNLFSKTDGGYIESGGFRISILEYEDGKNVAISFILEDSIGYH